VGLWNAALNAFGFKMGPVQNVRDLAGLDIGWSKGARLKTARSVTALCENGTAVARKPKRVSMTTTKPAAPSRRMSLQRRVKESTGAQASQMSQEERSIEVCI